ncbi:MAG: hypothetical protein HY342_09690 [Candidatus Lambdaproteobacteria bacterium]|nr:hypothetical protein [Candidatus Lambdaproteobacteria bacterium]
MFSKLLVLTMAALLLLGTNPVVHAQGLFDDLEQDDFLEGDDLFLDQTGDEAVLGTSEEDLTEGGNFIDDSPLTAEEGGVTEAARRTQLRALTDREMLPVNAAWGAGTGLLIGGWLAFINNGTSRETQRSIGLGIVIGSLIGLTVGLKTVIAPQAPSALGLRSDPFDDSAGRPLAAAGINGSPFKVGFAFRF